MGVWLALVRRELATFFKSLTGYVVISAVLLMIGYSMIDIIERLSGEATAAPVTEVFFVSSWNFWWVLLLIAPVITMRSFAAEKSSGTYEALMTSPVGDWQVVLAKFFGALFFFFCTWVPLALMLYFLRRISGEPALFEPRIIAITGLGITLIGSLFLAMGIFASALTKSQMIAAMLTFLMGAGWWSIGYPMPVAAGSENSITEILSYISAIRHMGDFARGIIDSRHVTLYLSVTWLFLFLTQRVVEGRRWR